MKQVPSNPRSSQYSPVKRLFMRFLVIVLLAFKLVFKDCRKSRKTCRNELLTNQFCRCFTRGLRFIALSS